MPEQRRRWFQLSLTTCIVMMVVAGGLVWANIRRDEVRSGLIKAGWPFLYFVGSKYIAFDSRSSPEEIARKRNAASDWRPRYAYLNALISASLLAAIACLALGIGANTAAFSFAWGILFQSAPMHEPERMVRLYVDWENGLEYGSFSYPDYVDLRDRSPAGSPSIPAPGW